MSSPQEPVEWLSDHERSAWMAILAMTMTLPSALDAQLKRDAGVNTFEYHILAALSESPTHSLQMSQLAVFAQGSLSRLSHAVGRLERSGWVQRQPSALDGRHTEALLTPAGWDKIQQIAPGHVREVRRLLIDLLSPTQLADLGATSRLVVGTIAPESAHLLDAGMPGEA